jgi:hypothetical protein
MSRMSLTGLKGSIPIKEMGLGLADNRQDEIKWKAGINPSICISFFPQQRQKIKLSYRCIDKVTHIGGICKLKML